MNSRLNSYKLVDKIAVKCSLEESFLCDKGICRDVFGEVVVSTVFLPFDHSFDGSSEPVLFETLVFGGIHDGFMQRYCTYDEAVEGHEKVCYMINKVAIERSSKLDNLGI